MVELKRSVGDIPYFFAHLVHCAVPEQPQNGLHSATNEPFFRRASPVTLKTLQIGVPVLYLGLLVLLYT